MRGFVTPHAGVRIEMKEKQAIESLNKSHPPRGGAN